MAALLLLYSFFDLPAFHYVHAQPGEQPGQPVATSIFPLMSIIATPMLF